VKECAVKVGHRPAHREFQGAIKGMLKDPLNSAGFNCLARMRDGWMLYNKNDQYIGASIGKYGEYSHGEMELFQRLLAEGCYVVEAGANIGAHTLGLSKRVGVTGRIYAYEPQRIVFQTLCANMAINSRSNVYCFEQAASNAKQVITLPELDYTRQGNFGGVAIDRFSSGRPVNVVVLDEELEDIPRLDLLKVDVEGMEQQVISGAKALIAKHRPVLYVENDRVEKSRALIELIQSLEYRLYWHIPKLYNPNNFVADKENIFGDIASFNMLCFHSDVHTNLTGFSEIVDSSMHPLGSNGGP
jgi:FkbM family methyltransferase